MGRAILGSSRKADCAKSWSQLAGVDSNLGTSWVEQALGASHAKLSGNRNRLDKGYLASEGPLFRAHNPEVVWRDLNPITPVLLRMGPRMGPPDRPRGHTEAEAPIGVSEWSGRSISAKQMSFGGEEE
jgi:hypothetical protein